MSHYLDSVMPGNLHVNICMITNISLFNFPFLSVLINPVCGITAAIRVGVDRWEFSGFWVGALEDAEGGQLHAGLEVVVAQRQVGTKLLAAVFERIDFLSVRRCLRQAIAAKIIVHYICMPSIHHTSLFAKL